MKRLCNLAVGLLLTLILPASTFLPSPVTAQTNQAPYQKRLLARGRYLVERVAMCADCHSPRNERGEFIRERWLQGTPLPFKPKAPMPVWADTAIPIAGLPGWSNADAIRFFSTGLDIGGKTARPPMPAFRLTERDAASVVAYLKSLKPSP